MAPIQYPAWLQGHMKRATDPGKQRWVGFAMAVHRDATRRRGPKGRAAGLAPLPKAETLPNGVSTRPDDRYWKGDPDRQVRRLRYLRESKRMKWVVHHHGGFFSGLGHFLSKVGHVITKIPVVGSIAKIAAGPFQLMGAIASGQRLDHALLGTLKSQVNAVRDVAPYVQMVVSFVPGIGTGIGAALAAGIALSKGRPITDAVLAGIKGALPGGQLAASGFDAAMSIAHGKPVLEAALHAARDQLPPVAQKAFDIGLSVAQGRKLQNVVKDAVTSLAPDSVKHFIATGTQMMPPGMLAAASHITHPKALDGFKFAAGLLSHAGINEEHLNHLRTKLSPHALQGFDAALHLQKEHIPWIRKVVAPAIEFHDDPELALQLPIVPNEELPQDAVPLAVVSGYTYYAEAA